MMAPASRRGFLRGLTTLPLIGGGAALMGGSPSAGAAPALNPDAALFALDAECQHLAQKVEEALHVRGSAYRATKARIGKVPDCLHVRGDDRSLVKTWPALNGGGNKYFHSGWSVLFDVKGGADHIWKGAGLDIALAGVVPSFGRAGLTPKRIRRWKALQPIAHDFDARVEDALQRYGYFKACEAHRAVEAELMQCRGRFHDLPAQSIEGLAVHVTRFQNMPVENMPEAWRSLLFGAANVCGIGAANVGWRRDA